jgi:hypothetical protein
MEAGVEVGGAEFRALFGRVASDPEWIRRVSREVTDAIHRDLPELGDDEGVHRVHGRARDPGTTRPSRCQVTAGHW